MKFYKMAVVQKKKKSKTNTIEKIHLLHYGSHSQFIIIVKAFFSQELLYKASYFNHILLTCCSYSQMKIEYYGCSLREILK